MSDRKYSNLPKATTTYINVVKSMLPVVSDKPKGKKNVLPEATYTVDNLKIDQSNLRDYRRICGFSENGLVPPTYFSVLSQTLQMNMMAQEAFPFAMLGLVHIQNSITQYRSITDSEKVKMAVSFANLTDHAKGKQFDFVTTVHADDELIWEGTSTYLSRQKTNKSTNSKKSSIKSTPSITNLRYVFEVPEDIGRRYAKISGDFNLIHLHPLTAKAFGFPKAIAHGMWSKAKCLSYIDLPEAFSVDVSFKLPILLPSEVILICNDLTKNEESGEIGFELVDAKKNKPHLTGKVNLNA